MNEELQSEVKRLKLTIVYDGAPWHGWQTLPTGNTVQDQVELALNKISGVEVRTHGSGRTDAGVHALGQVAHADVPSASKLSDSDWTRALNAVLPKTIRILQTEAAPQSFHARYDATAKVYRYRIWRPDVMSPFEAGRAWHVFGPLDLDSVRDCIGSLTGKHNFARLSVNRGDVTDEERRSDVEYMTRTLSRIDMAESDETVEIEIEGDGFLYKMVRLIVGSLMHVARGRETTAWFRSLLAEPDGLKSHVMAPPDGLYLVRVKY